MPRPVTRHALLPCGILAMLLIAACGSAATPAPDAVDDSAPAAAPAVDATELTDVTIALSWTPNTDYTGVYVAQQNGYYEQAGLQVTTLPYAGTLPETLVAQGVADFGFSYQAGVVYGRAAGLDIISVLAPNQRGTYAIAVRADRADLTRPRDLDGRVYAGFGSPDEVPLLQSIIRNDGGRGEFERVTLDTAAYQAVYNGRADFTISVVTWDGVEAGLSNQPVRTFPLTDYGFPEQYSTLIITSEAFRSANLGVTRAFLAATQRGYEFAAANPRAAAQAVIDRNPDAFPNPALVFASEELLAAENYRRAANGRVGAQQARIWSEYGDFLFDNGLLADASGQPLARRPQWTQYWTNDDLPPGTL